MAYRSSREALESRRITLEGELRGLRLRAADLEALREREADVARELRETEARIQASPNPDRRLPVLEDVRIATPCRADWDAMVGDDRVRFCGGCQKNVYDLSALERDEAEALIRANEHGELCARLYRRVDGTVLTADCAVGLRKKRNRRLALAAVGGGLLAAGALSRVGGYVPVGHTMGAAEIAPMDTTQEATESVPAPPPEVPQRTPIVPLRPTGEVQATMGAVRIERHKPPTPPKGSTSTLAPKR